MSRAQLHVTTSSAAIVARRRYDTLPTSADYRNNPLEFAMDHLLATGIKSRSMGKTLSQPLRLLPHQRHAGMTFFTRPRLVV